MLKDFKAFIMRGNVLDLAVAVVIGAAFGGVVKSLVDDVIMPPIGLALGKVDFSNLYLLLQDGTKAAGPYASLADAKAAGAVTLNYGLFFNSIFGFLIVAAAVFVIVRAASKMSRQPAPAPPNTKECPYCRNAIPLNAIRCGHCTSQLEGNQAIAAAAAIAPVR
ncbi:MAG TPA: large conductance mechanosensitive channel protein MscL [Gemmatimonadaceae bacterium]|nr:large conductance mechanosensitive channel protein MscL [Gemmatimonadaceae bacterium]